MSPLRMLFLPLLLLTTALNAQSTSFRGLPLCHNFTTEDYQAGIQNWDIAQDQYGVLYVANNFGLLSFDGEQWGMTEIQGATRIRAVYMDAAQQIYIGGQGDFGYLAATDSGRSEFHSLKTHLPEEYQNFDEVWTIHEVGGDVYFCTFRYIFKYANDKVEVIDPQAPIGFAFSLNNRLYVKHQEHGLAWVQDKKLLPLPNAGFFQDKEVRGISPFAQNSLLIATQRNGFFLYREGQITPWDIPTAELLAEAQINCLLRLSNHYLAVGTQNKGLFILDHKGNQVYSLGKNRGLSSQTVLSLHQDQLGNLWAGLNNGISYIELEQPFTLIGDELGVPGTGYAAGKFEGKMYLGTSNGLFQSPSNSDRKTRLMGNYQLVEGTAGQAYSLQAIDQELFLGHHNGGFIVREGKAQRIKSPFLGAWKVMPIVPGEKMLAGAYNGMYLLEKRGGRWEVAKKYANFQESSRKFEKDVKGDIWMSHGYKGVYRLRFSEDYERLLSVKHYTEKDGFPSNLLINVFKIGGKLRYAADEGVYIYDSDLDRFVPDPELNPLFEGEHVREMEEDLVGNIFFLTGKQLGVIQKDQFGNLKRTSSHFQKVVPLISDDLENITVIDPSNVLIDAKSGFIHFDPSKPLRSDAPFPTLIRNVERGGMTIFAGHHKKQASSLQEAQAGKLANRYDYGQTSIKFRFSSTFFEGMEATEYQYRLNGYEEQWSEWTGNTEKEYTNLLEGEYTFRVRAKNVYGQVGDEASFTFQILPPWYRSIYARVLYVALAIVSFGLLWLWLDKRYRKKQDSLKVSTQQEIERKDVELKAVTEQSEQAITQLKNEKLQVEIDAKNRELAASATHLIHKNEFLSHLKNTAKNLAKEAEGKELARQLNKMVKEIDRNVAEDQTWQLFEMHFNQVHGDFTRKIKRQYPNLTPQELRLSAFLRMNMSTKEVAHLLNISVRGVEISRYRLRKKLGITREVNLVEFMMEI